VGYGSAQLSGSGDYSVALKVDYISSVGWANYSTFRWEVFLDKGASQVGSWIEDPQSWSANIGGVPRSGTFSIPYATRGQNSRSLGAGYVDIYHNPDGTRPEFDSSASVSTAHSAIGSGTVSGVKTGAPRIPKVPAATYWADPPIDTVTSDSFRVHFAFWPRDDGGTPIREYQVETTREGDLLVETFNFGAGSGGNELIPGREPARLYTVRTRARNDVGWGPWSSVQSVTTLSGIFTSDGANWVAQPVRVSNGSAWVNADPTISDGDSWEDPINA